MNALLQITEADTGEAFLSLFEKILEWCVASGTKVIISLVIAFVSFKLINFFAKRITKRLKNNEKYDKIYSDDKYCLGYVDRCGTEGKNYVGFEGLCIKKHNRYNYSLGPFSKGEYKEKLHLHADFSKNVYEFARYEQAPEDVAKKQIEERASELVDIEE